jgi:sucrase/ferredoxin-like protein
VTAAGRPERCAVAALRRGDSPVGTAAPGARWLLIEHPGPWSVHAFDLSPELGLLARRATSLGGRAVLIRRPGGHVPRSGQARPPRSWALVDTRPGRERTWWGTFTDEAELLDVPLDPPAGAPTGEPVFLVCTQGRHDACCAIEGRPVAQALAAAYPEQTWECSHIGGCRFAANLVMLPHGLVYAWATEQSAVELAGAYRHGAVLPTTLRGRSGLATPVQAAQHEARTQLGVTDVDALAPHGVTQLGPDSWEVRLAHPDGELVVRVDSAWSAPDLLTCQAPRPRRSRVFSAHIKP